MTTWEKTAWRPEGHEASYKASYVLCEKCGGPTDVILEDLGETKGVGNYDYVRWCPACGHKFAASKYSLRQIEGKGEPFTYGDPTYSPS
jgi:DNA-directed RNA polymerase subunit RPC12/RpoP